MEPTKHPMFPIVMMMAGKILEKILPEIIDEVMGSDQLENKITEAVGYELDYNREYISRYDAEELFSEMGTPELSTMLENGRYDSYARKELLKMLTSAIEYHENSTTNDDLRGQLKELLS